MTPTQTVEQYKYWQQAQPLGPWFQVDNTAKGIPVGPEEKGFFVTEALAQAVQKIFNFDLVLESELKIDLRYRSDDGVNERWLLAYTDNRGRQLETPIGQIRAEMCNPFLCEPYEKFSNSRWIGIVKETAMSIVGVDGLPKGIFEWCDGQPNSNGLTFNFVPDTKRRGQ